MKLRVGAATIAKRGNSAEENEDAFAPAGGDGFQFAPFNLAIADGATETSYSGLWARLLTDAFCTADSISSFQAAIPRVRSEWRTRVSAKPLPWYAEQKLEQGAFATLVGVRITVGEFSFLKWHAIAAGDSVLFHVRACEAVAKFPPLGSQDFSNRPTLVATSKGGDEVDGQSIYSFAEGILEPGDRLYLATDKVAEWIIRSLETDTKPFLQLDQVVRTPHSFDALMENLAQHHDIKDDDYTLMWVEAHADEP